MSETFRFHLHSQCQEEFQKLALVIDLCQLVRHCLTIIEEDIRQDYSHFIYPLSASQRALLLWLTRAQKQSSFCLLQNRRPESRSPTFRRPADRGYNTLDFASKVRVPKGALPPLDSPIISVSRIQNLPCRFYILALEIKKAPSPSSKGMLTVLLCFYPKVVFLQYCVSVGCGVVSLTKWTSGLPTGNRLVGYT